MYWGHLRRVGSHIKSSLWTVPLLAIPVAMIATRLVHWLDAQREWTLLGLGVAGAQAMLQAATTCNLIIPGLYIRLFAGGDLGRKRSDDAQHYRDDFAARQCRPLHGGLVHTHVHLSLLGCAPVDSIKSISCLARCRTRLALACFAAFLYLIDYASRLLRPIAVLTHVANEGIAVIKSVYPEPEPRSGCFRKVSATPWTSPSGSFSTRERPGSCWRSILTH